MVVMLCWKGAESLVCLSCDDVVNARSCNTLRTCSSHEVCFHTQKVTDTGRIYRKLGCRDSLQCKKPTIGRKRGKRSDVTLCDSCCDTDFCQTKLCHDHDPDETAPAGAVSSGSSLFKDFTQPHGPFCFACETQTEEKCNKFQVCGRDEVCFETLNMGVGGGDSVKTTKCFSKAACDAVVSSLQPFGKRDGVFSHDECVNCCSTDFCNNNCTMKIPTAATLNNMGTGSTTVGTTTPTTPTPCTDLTPPDTCKIAAQFVCSDRDKAQNANCLHYCKWC